MCGITGIFNYKSFQQPDKEILSNMLIRISHRGPDESGIYLNQNIGLGHVRLSILDLKTGSQPMSDENGFYWIVFNGEIFNYIELRNELVKKAYKFRTTSDTEVLLYLYKEYGAACLSKLNGQFAFAIWNKKKKELFLARDRVGIRPLFYTNVSGSFIFGSEIKSILEHPDVTPEISSHSLFQIFTFWTTITPNTAFKDIYELPPGHFMLVNSKGIQKNHWWELKFPSSGEENNISFKNAVEELNKIYSDAVKIRLRADVPVGAYLSGGLDSSIITSYIKDIFPDILRTFSIGFAESEFDESSYQKIVVDYLKTKHSGVQCSSEEIANIFPEVIWHTETPLLRTSPAPMYLLSNSVRENNYKVVITGEGADEIFAGYNIFKETIIRRFWAKQPGSRIRPLLLQKLYPYIPQLSERPGALKFFFGYKLTETDSPFYSHLLRWHNTSRINSFFSDEIKSQLKNYDPIIELKEKLPVGFNNWNALSKAQWLETKIFMSGYLLSSQGDRMAMANSIEGRYPFLDHRIIEFAATLPADYKLKGLNEKYLLKQLMQGRLPDSILKRSKQAYRAPIQSAFLSKNAPDYVKQLLSPAYIKKAGVFNPDSISVFLSKLEKTGNSSEVENMILTAIISTHLLYHQFIDKQNKKLSSGKLNNLKIIKDF